MKVVQEVLRHSSYAITADIYSHVAVEQQREAAERLGEVFRW
jgi:integrase